jgi:uncharacterized membrane protein
MHTDALQIVVAAFPSEDGAANALRRVKELAMKRGNAAVIRRGEDGTLRIKETDDWGIGKSALIGAVAAIILPGIGPILGAAIGAAASYLIDAGFPDESLRRMGATLTPQSSALVVLVDSAQRTAAEQVLLDAGGQVVSGGLDAQLAQQIDTIASAPPEGSSPPPPSV